MPMLNNAPAQIYHQLAGEGECALLLTHGYASSSDMWGAQVEALQTDCRVLTWDMRGHARTDCLEEQQYFNHDHALDDMIKLLDLYDIERAVIGGHSLGGYLSLLFYLRYPERTQGLLLECTGPGYRSDSGRSKWNQFAQRQADKYAKHGLLGLPADAVEIPRDLHRSSKGLSLAAQGILAQQDSAVIDSLSSIKVPTLIVTGELDDAYHAGGEYMNQKISNSRHIQIKGAGHAPNIDEPEAFNRHLLDFFNVNNWSNN